MWFGQRLLGVRNSGSGSARAVARMSGTHGRSRSAAASGIPAAQWFALAYFKSVVVDIRLEIRVKEFLKPLDELEIVLKATFHQLVDGHDLTALSEMGMKSKNRPASQKQGKRKNEE